MTLRMIVCRWYLVKLICMDVILLSAASILPHVRSPYGRFSIASIEGRLLVTKATALHNAESPGEDDEDRAQFARLSSIDRANVPIIPKPQQELFEVDPTLGSAASLVGHASNTPHDRPTVWKSRKELFQMTRPSSIAGTFLFHMLGIYLVLQHTQQSHRYWTILIKHPLSWLTLLAVNLVSATSMVVNDYYDAKLGRDDLKAADKVLLRGDVSPATCRRFLMLLYGTALCVSNVLPGAPTRLSVTIGLMLTYLYTKHLKPITGIKNITCAALIALAPWTSGSFALSITATSSQAHAVATSTIVCGLMNVPSLWRLFMVLFTGVWARELLMDVGDHDADGAAGVRTVPVVQGRQRAILAAAVGTVGMGLLTTVPHLKELVRLSSAVPVVSSAPFRRFVLSGVATSWQVLRTWQIHRTKGLDTKLISKAVDENLVTVVLLLASFV